MLKTINDTFTASEASRLTGMNVETLRVWRRRGYFTLDGEREGWTRYTFADVLKVATFRTLTESFVAHDLAEMVTANCAEQFAKILEGGVDLPSPYLVCGRGLNGDVVFEVASGPDAASLRVLELMSAGHPALITTDYLSILSRVFERLREMNES